MKTIAIVGRNFHPDGKETAELIAQSLQGPLSKKGYTTQFVQLKDILFDISNKTVRVIDSKTGKDLKEFSAVLMTNWLSHASIRKDVAYALALYLEKNKIPFVNTETFYSRSTSKLSQLMLAALYGVTISRTVFCIRLAATRAYLDNVAFPAPFIFKNGHASRGKGNYLLATINDINIHANEHSETSPFLVQSFVESDKSDYRLFMVNGKVQLVIHRLGQAESHLHNTSAGATTELVPVKDLNAEAVRMAETMSAVLHRELTGLDIIFDSKTQEPYFLEANPIPQIATGSNVETKLAALAEGLVKLAEKGINK